MVLGVHRVDSVDGARASQGKRIDERLLAPHARSPAWPPAPRRHVARPPSRRPAEGASWKKMPEYVCVWSARAPYQRRSFCRPGRLRSTLRTRRHSLASRVRSATHDARPLDARDAGSAQGALPDAGARPRRHPPTRALTAPGALTRALPSGEMRLARPPPSRACSPPRPTLSSPPRRWRRSSARAQAAGGTAMRSAQNQPGKASPSCAQSSRTKARLQRTIGEAFKISRKLITSRLGAEKGGRCEARRRAVDQPSRAARRLSGKNNTRGPCPPTAGGRSLFAANSTHPRASFRRCDDAVAATAKPTGEASSTRARGVIEYVGQGPRPSHRAR